MSCNLAHILVIDILFNINITYITTLNNNNNNNNLVVIIAQYGSVFLCSLYYICQI